MDSAEQWRSEWCTKEGNGMFARWGRFVFRHRWAVLIAMLALLIVAVPFAGKANSALISGGWFNRNAESSKV
jgi:hypothetical protein